MTKKTYNASELGCGCLLLLPAVLAFIAVCVLLVRVIVWAVVG